MDKVQDIVTDVEINAVWGAANFGIYYTQRQVIAETVLKCAAGFSTGSTAERITRALGLVNQKTWTLTKKGRLYLWAEFRTDKGTV